jgi:CHAD domain-containing protein
MQLDGTTPLWIAARALLKERASDFRRRLADVLHSFDAEAIHDLRVSSRRMREGLALFAPCYSPGASTRLDRRIRRVTRLLGEIRNRDEALLFFAALRDKLDSSCHSELDRLLAAFRCERNKEVAELRTGLKDISALSLARRYRQVVNFPCLFTPAGAIDLFAPLADFARETLSSRLADVLQLVPAARQEGNFAAQHQLRIAVKHFRYRMEILSFLLNSGYKERYAAVKGYQEVLGRMHDLDVFAAVCREAGFAQQTATAVLEAIAQQRSRLFTDFSAMLTTTPFEAIGESLRNRL